MQRKRHISHYFHKMIVGAGILMAFPTIVFAQKTQKTDTLSTQDTTKVEPYRPSYRPNVNPTDRYGNPFTSPYATSPLYLGNPSDFKTDLEMDTGFNYEVHENIGNLDYRPPSKMSFQQYDQYMQAQEQRNYFRSRSLGLDGESAVSGRQLIPPLYVSPILDRLFGGSFVQIVPNGFVTLDLGGRVQKNKNPNLPVRQQRYGSFDFNQQISMNVVGKVGDKLKVTANFDNNNSFDFQNDLKVEYTGYEEEIIKKIEIGNVSMPVANTLMTGAQNLFGVKTQLQFGKLYVTGIATTQRGKVESINIDAGGAQAKQFEIRASDYDENRHFFLGQFFRDNYQRWLQNLPQITSGVNITRVEVYVINRTQSTNQLRTIAAFMDLGEGNKNHIYQQAFYPSSSSANPPTNNEANPLWGKLQALPKDADGFQSGINTLGAPLTKTVDYEMVNVARKLDPSEYTVNDKLGYISLERQLQNDELLAVAYEYTYNGKRYQVGELTENYGSRPADNAIILKLLRPTKINTEVPTWDLMMKNIYNLGGSQIEQDNFQLRIIYRDDRTGQDNPSLQESSLKDEQLIRLLGLDSLNQNNDSQPDGNFDYVDGVTINSNQGKIIFPVLEPFGQRLSSLFRPNEEVFKNKYVFNTLYRSTKNDAQQETDKDKFYLKGSYQAGSASEIKLPGINIAPNSVRVTAGSTPLQEGVDYRVDYTFGKVIILNQGILNSGKPLRVTYEKADLFNFQSRTLLGARFDYRFNDHMNLGATVLKHYERPVVSRVAIGSEPNKNTKWGLDFNYSNEMPLLTKMVDFLPFIDTKAPSTINFSGEFAQLIPGTSNIVDGEGTSYIDDFENSAVPSSLGGDITDWKLAATPKTPDKDFFANGTLGANGKRAKLAWYIIDNVFYPRSGRDKPANITEQDLNNDYVRAVESNEIFKNRDPQIGSNLETVFNMAYYPSERGPYNYNVDDFNADGSLKNPKENWGGITRAISSDVDFDKNNIEYIEFWMMDPFIQGKNGVVDDGSQNATNNTTGGELVFNLGNVSEDLMPDGKQFYENGLPANGGDQNVVRTDWGRVPTQPPLTNNFDNTPGARANQDVGFDGLKDEQEKSFFQSFVQQVQNSGVLSPEAKDKIIADPSADDFNYFLGNALDDQNATILERYKNYNNAEGNTPEAGNQNYIAAGSRFPDNEDINDDNTVSDLEQYYEYKVNLKPNQMEVGKNHIVDEVTSNKDGAKWYLFRIPVREPDRVEGNLDGFKTIRYIRTYLTQFQQPVVLRMVNFRLVGSQWRKYDKSLYASGLDETRESDNKDFVVSVVNLEENADAGPNKVAYTLPPGIRRDRDNTSVIERRQNEQSLQLSVKDLKNKDAVAAFKNVNLDLVNYGKLKMFLHAESPDAKDQEVTAFLRLGTDFNQNYYEIEVPLKITPYGSVDQNIVWPEENNIDIDFDQLYALKSKRNRLRQNADITLPYSEQVGKYHLTVRGRPDMSAVQTIMIGIRNPDDGNTSSKTVTLWANELRVSKFDKTKGYAADATLNTQMADFANITASTRFTSVGFGDIQDNIAQRTREKTTELDMSANFKLDKFFPEALGLQIPMYLGFQRSVSVPFYDPLDPDIPLSASLLSIDDPQKRAEYQDIVTDQTTRRSINFTNVRKNRTNKDRVPLPIDISNFNFTYAFSDVHKSNVQTAEYLSKNYKGALGYTYPFPKVSIKPFSEAKWASSPYLKLVHDINLSPLPSNFTFRGDIDRTFVKTQYRNDQLTTEGYDPQYEKSFTFIRNYSLSWDLTEKLNLNYTARANAVIDEAPGEINTQEKIDSLWTNILALGRMKNFDQTITANYQLPLDKLPFTDWISSEARYSTGYNWTAGSYNQIDSLGNIIQNNREYGLTGRFDLSSLYNKVLLINRMNNAPPKGSKGDTLWINSKRGGAARGFLHLLTSVKNISFDYSIKEGTVLPGFKKRAYLFGLDSGFNAPGIPFLLGSQDPDIRFRAAQNGWLATGVSQTAPFTQGVTNNWSIQADVEPLKDLKIQLNMKKSLSQNYQEIFRYAPDNDQFQSLTPTISGNYSITYNLLHTAFKKDRGDNSSPVFEQFEKNRSVIKQRLEAENTANGYYLQNQQDVLIPAFLAAYSGQDVNNIELNPFPKMPLPNWRIDYNGLMNIEALKDIFSSITLNHAYNSSYEVNNFVSSTRYDNISPNQGFTKYPLPTITSDSGNYLPVYVVSQVMLTERFAPLVGVSVRTKNRLTATLEFKKERSLVLSTQTSQVTELKNSDVSFDMGFTDTDFKLPFRVKGRVITLKNEINFKLGVSVRDTKTIQRTLDGDNQIVNGSKNLQIRPTVGYVLNKKLNLNFYFEKSVNNPYVTNSYLNTTTAFGIQVRFSLQQ